MILRLWKLPRRRAPALGQACLLVAVGVPFDAALADHPSLSVLGAVATPVTTVSAIPAPRGTWSIGLRGEHIDFDAFSDRQLIEFAERDPEADIHSIDSLTSVSLGAAYGLTDNLTLGVTLPYVRRDDIREAHGHHDEGDEQENGEEEPPEIERLGDSEGVGDAVLFGQYRFLHDPAVRTSAAVVAGVKTPTGETGEESKQGERLETDLQPGSGSWDPLVGAAFTRNWNNTSLDASVLYKLATEGSQNTDLGDVLAYNVAVSHRLSSEHEHHHAGAHHEHAGHGTWDLILELNGEWRQKEDIDGDTNDDSGGNLLYLSPAIRYASGSRWGAALSVGIPIVKDLNGEQVDPQWRVIGAISVGF